MSGMSSSDINALQGNALLTDIYNRGRVSVGADLKRWQKEYDLAVKEFEAMTQRFKDSSALSLIAQGFGSDNVGGGSLRARGDGGSSNVSDIIRAITGYDLSLPSNNISGGQNALETTQPANMSGHITLGSNPLDVISRQRTSHMASVNALRDLLRQTGSYL